MLRDSLDKSGIIEGSGYGNLSSSFRKKSVDSK